MLVWPVVTKMNRHVKSCILPKHDPKIMHVGILDLEQYRSTHPYCACSTTQIRCIPYSGASNDTDVFSLYDVKAVLSKKEAAGSYLLTGNNVQLDDQTHEPMRLMV